MSRTITCPTCKIEFNESYFSRWTISDAEGDHFFCSKKCRDEYTPRDSTPIKENFFNQNNQMIASGSQGSNASRIAIESARIVNAYGTVIQVLGVILGVLVIIGGFFLAHHNGAIYAVSGLLIGFLDISIFAVQGALFRMISNYVIARLEN